MMAPKAAAATKDIVVFRGMSTLLFLQSRYGTTGSLAACLASLSQRSRVGGDDRGARGQKRIASLSEPVDPARPWSRTAARRKP